MGLFLNLVTNTATMTKLSLELTETLGVQTSCPRTAAILGLAVNGDPVPIEPLLANTREVDTLQHALSNLEGSFLTFELVFVSSHIEKAPGQDRSVLQNVVHANPVRALHICGSNHLACLVHLERTCDCFQLTALEYSRSFRKRQIQQEFGSWLLEENVEMAVIATTMTGQVVFWNRFSEQLYKYTKEEAMGQSIMELTPSEMSQEQGMQIMQQLSQGINWKGMFKVKDKNQRSFTAHVIDTPILDENNNCKYIVGLSADYTLLHDTLENLETLNQNLNKEVQKRTNDLLQRETTLRRIGAAVQQSDTGVLIVSRDGTIVWSNQAVCRMMVEEMVVGGALSQLPLRAENHHHEPEAADSEVHLGLDEYFEQVVQSGESLNDPSLYVPTNSISTTRVLQVQAHKLDELEFMLTVRDMTAERSAADALLEAEKAAATSQTKTHMMHMLSHDVSAYVLALATNC